MTPTHQASGFELERLVFFSDAVFAIVITLLVLPLTAEIELPEGGEGVGQHVLGLWPQVLTFVVSFLVIGQFWIAHHSTFGLLRRMDHGLLWLNLISLLTVSFLPFPAAVLGADRTGDPFAVVFYAASLTACSLAMTATWIYAVRRDLVDPRLPAAGRRTVTARALVTSAIFLVSIGAAFAGILVAAPFWVVLLPAARVLLARRAQAPRLD